MCISLNIRVNALIDKFNDEYQQIVRGLSMTWQNIFIEFSGAEKMLGHIQNIIIIDKHDRPKVLLLVTVQWDFIILTKSLIVGNKSSIGVDAKMEISLQKPVKLSAPSYPKTTKEVIHNMPL